MAKLHGAVAAGDLAGVQRLIREQINLNPADDEGRTPLHHAIDLKHDDIAFELLRNGADPALRYFTVPDNPTDVGMNCLHWAAFRGRSAIVRAILDLGVVPIDSTGAYLIENHLFFACALILSLDGGGFNDSLPSFSCPDAALALIEAGANPNLEFHEWCTVLHYCAFRREGMGTDQQRLAVMAAAIGNGARLDVYARMGFIESMQPLHAAVYSGFYEAAKLLIQHGAQINFQPNDFNVPPLSLAPYGGNVETFRMLLEHGADINCVDYRGFGFLHYCVGHGWGLPVLPATVPARQEMMRLALELGADVAHTSGQDYYRDVFITEGLEKLTALHTACTSGATWAIAPLVEAGADVNARNAAGHTPLIIACGNCDCDYLLAVIHAMLIVGGDLHARMVEDDSTALQILFRRYRYHKEEPDPYQFNILGSAIAALVVAGDRTTAAIPFACPGLEAALVPVWRDAESDESAAEAMPAIFKRLEAPVQARVRTALLTLHRFCSALPKELRWTIMETALA